MVGHTYMLNQDEELWEKQLTQTVEDLLTSGIDPLANRSDGRIMFGVKSQQAPQPPSLRNKTKVVSFRVPHNAAVQVYDYKQKKAR